MTEMYFFSVLEAEVCDQLVSRDGNSLVVQWLGLHALTAEGPGSIPGRGTKILQAAHSNQKKKRQQGWFLLRPLSLACGRPSSLCVLMGPSSVRVCVPTSSSYEDTCGIGLGPPS